MKCLFAFGVIPVPVFYRDTLKVLQFFFVWRNKLPIPRWRFIEVGGFSSLVLIIIRSKYRNDQGLLLHELTHAKQFWCLTLGLFVGVMGASLQYTVPYTQVALGCALVHPLLYLTQKWYRQWAEVQAYRVQIAYYGPGVNVDFAVRALVGKYQLGITREEASKLLLE